MSKKYAILVDGGFMKKRVISSRLPQRSPATFAEITTEFERIKSHDLLRGLDLLRIYFYDAPPATGKLKNPIDGSEIDLSNTPNFSANQSLQQSLELYPDVALRSGEIAVRGWELGQNAQKEIRRNNRPLTERDFVPNIQQKGVDLRIGLDIARLSLQHLVDVIVVVTGDSDMIPAFKFARREGIRMYLDCMGHSVRRDLMVHVDRIIS